MNLLAQQKAVLAIFLGCALPLAGTAGERIIIGTRQNPEEPNQEKKFDESNLKLWNRGGNEAGFSTPYIPAPPVPLPKDSKQRKDELDRKLWRSPQEIASKKDDEEARLAEPESQSERFLQRLLEDSDRVNLNSKKTTSNRAEQEEEEPQRDERRRPLMDSNRDHFGDQDPGRQAWFGNQRPRTTVDRDALLHDFVQGGGNPLPSDPRDALFELKRPGEPLSGAFGSRERLTPAAERTPATPGPVLPPTPNPAVAASRAPDFGPYGGGGFSLPGVGLGARAPEDNSRRMDMPAFGGASQTPRAVDPRFARPTVMGGSMFNQDLPQRPR